MCMKQFYSWSFLENVDEHKLVTYKTSFIFQTCPFFPSLCCLSDTLVFWLIHHSPGYFPAWNCSQRVMNECSALTLLEQRAQLPYAPKLSEYDGFELLQKSLLPHLPYPWNWTSHGQFSIQLTFLRRKKRWWVQGDSVTVILSWYKTQQWGEMGCSAGRELAHCWTSREGSGIQTAFSAAVGLHPWQKLFWKQAVFTSPVFAHHWNLVYKIWHAFLKANKILKRKKKRLVLFSAVITAEPSKFCCYYNKGNKVLWYLVTTAP